MQQQKNQERRQLGLPAAIAVVTGEAIALGIFLTPAAMAKSLGSPLLLGLVWLGVALMAMCGALSYSALAIRFPESGGEYVYLRAGYGEQVAFLYGWTSSIVMYPGVAAALAVGAAPYVAQLLPRGGQDWPLLPRCSFAYSAPLISSVRASALQSCRSLMASNSLSCSRWLAGRLFRATPMWPTWCLSLSAAPGRTHCFRRSLGG